MRCSVFQLGTLWQEVRCIVVRNAVMCISVGYSAVGVFEIENIASIDISINIGKLILKVDIEGR